MTAKRIERAAYVAAHRIVDANTLASELVCRGARRSRAVDTIAEIIREVFELDSAHDDKRIEQPAGPSLHLVNARRKSAVPRLPSGAYPDEVA